MRISPHATIAFWRQLGQLWNQFAVAVEEFFRAVAFHPILEHFQMVWIRLHPIQRDLMSAISTFHLLAINYFCTCPTFGSSENDHRPDRSPARAALAAFGLNGADLIEDLIKRMRHELVHRLRIMPFHKVRLIAISNEQR